MWLHALLFQKVIQNLNSEQNELWSSLCTEGLYSVYLNTKSAESISFPHLLFLMMPPFPMTAHFLYCDLEYGMSWMKKTNSVKTQTDSIDHRGALDNQIDIDMRLSSTETMSDAASTHIWEHFEDFGGDGKDPAGVHLVPQLGPCGSVPLGGEQKGGSVTASRQRHPSGRHRGEDGVSSRPNDHEEMLHPVKKQDADCGAEAVDLLYLLFCPFLSVLALLSLD